MKAVMISVTPKMCEKVASGDCTILVRKTRPKIHTPFKCYIYQTKKFVPVDITDGVNKHRPFLRKNQAKVIGEFVCDKICELKTRSDDYGRCWHEWNEEWCDESGMQLSYEDIDKYLGKNHGYGWHISDLVVYDEPRDVGEFRVPCKFAYSSYEKGICYEDCIQGRLEDCRNFCLPLTSPPKIWQYVEEKEC